MHQSTVRTEFLTRTKLAGNQPSLSMMRPHHHSLLVASTTSMTSPALKPNSWSSMVTWSQSPSAYTTLPSLMSCRETTTGGTVVTCNQLLVGTAVESWYTNSFSPLARYRCGLKLAYTLHGHECCGHFGH